MNTLILRQDRPRHTRVTTILCLMLFLFMCGCSRSAWMKLDGNEVSPKEQLSCAEEIGEAPENRSLDYEELQPKIEACMLNKGYQRRPWWHMKDLHWNVHSLQ